MKLKLSPQWKSVITGEAQKMIVGTLNATDTWDITEDEIKSGMICKINGTVTPYGINFPHNPFVVITKFDKDNRLVYYNGLFGVKGYPPSNFDEFKVNYKAIYDPSEEV